MSSCAGCCAELPVHQPGDAETDRYRLFEAAAGLLGEIAAHGPLLIVLDHLHRVAAVQRAMLALLDGCLDDAERLTAEALTAGIQPDGITASVYFAIQSMALRREQLRLGEFEQTVRGWSSADRSGCCGGRRSRS